MKSKRNYPSKVLLLGEYTVLLGSDALAVPFDHFQGRWCNEPLSGKMKTLLHEWIKYLQNKEGTFPVDFDLSDFEKEIDAGLGFCSDIPIGYGLGSSGAITAAVWDRYGRDIDDVDQLLKVLSTMESFFHGKSSGLDPLVSLSNRPVLTGRKTSYPDPSCWQNFELKQHLFLWNSGMERRTASLVKSFTDNLKDFEYRNLVTKELVPQNDAAINALVNGDPTVFDRAWKKISEVQLDIFKEMIPEVVRKRWESGLDKEHFFFKLCGAGGGGYFLVYAPQTLPGDVTGQKDLMPL